MLHSLLKSITLILLVCCPVFADSDSFQDDPDRANRVLNVPSKAFSTIQAAIDAADDGDTVLIARGVYHESLHIDGKTIRLASEALYSQDDSDVRRTILDGSIQPDPDPEDDIDAKVDQVIYIGKDVGPETTIFGLTIRDGDDGIACYGKVRIVRNHFVNNVDGIDYEGGGGLCDQNLFIANDDDGVDLDLACEVIVSSNRIEYNDDDGIEMRFHEYAGEQLRVVIRDNQIIGNGEDGIQLIDYPDASDRYVRIERNLIAANAMAGIGMMSDGVTEEDYRGAAIPEPIEIIRNTIAENQFGIAGGAAVMLNQNVIIRNQRFGVFRVAGESIVGQNLFWANDVDYASSNVDQAQAELVDPQLDEGFHPLESSPCVANEEILGAYDHKNINDQ